MKRLSEETVRSIYAHGVMNGQQEPIHEAREYLFVKMAIEEGFYDMARNIFSLYMIQDTEAIKLLINAETDFRRDILKEIR